MANLFKQLQALKTNVFGGPGNTGETKPPATRVQDIDLQASPTGLASSDPFNFQTLSYPLDVTNNYQNGHYMLFYVNVQNKTKYTYEASDVIQIPRQDDEKGLSPAQINQKTKEQLKRGVYKGADAAGAGTGVSASVISGTGGAAGGATNRTDLKRKKGVQSNFNNTRRISDSVAMYLPPNVEDTTTATYNDSKTGVAGFLAASGINAADKDASAIAASLVAGAQGILGDMAAKSAGIVAELAGAEGGEQLAKKAFGVADNPYMEVLFDSMGLRTFTYNFNMAPKNEIEANEVQKIIQLFRFHMAPELRPGINRYLGLPSQFDIHYMFLSKDGQASENSFYNKISTCVLQDCKVNYTPNGVKSFEDGGPTAMTMSLTFKEIELMTKDKIAEGF
jgi:hypothetical protein